MISQLLGGHFDILLEDLVIPIRDDIYEGLIFLLSFIMDPPQDASENREMICSQIYCIINEFPSLCHSISSGGMNEGISNVNFSDFMLKVDRVKEKVKKLYVMTPYSSQLRPPFTNLIGFLVAMIGNLKEMLHKDLNLIPSLRQKGELLLKELVLLKPIVRNIIELLQDENEGIRDLWTSLTSIVYNADYFTKLCLLRGLYMWYCIVSLPGVIEDIKSISIEMNKLVGVDRKYNKKQLPHHDQVEGTNDLQSRRTTSTTERNFIGFVEDQRVIINELTRGQKSLTIISVSGSGGQGKTTLAKRIYNDPNVQHHFQKSVWCYVSQNWIIKEILVQILTCDTNSHGANELGMHDLAERVRRSLKGSRYLIVMDDIWDLDGWRKLEPSFPDDKNGSRILFTSRNHDLASQVTLNSIPHPLPLFSNEESWELIRNIVFAFDNCDEELVEIGKEMASYCKGLPLAVALIAGVLRRSKQSLDTWNKVAENLKVHLAEEGCGNVIELSYRYLPDHLKSCFLYFGAFRRGESVRAKELKLLWRSEGFIVQDRETKSSKADLESDCLEDLVSQSLVVVNERSSMGGIKRCNVHDLLHDLCLERCKEDGFLTWTEEGSIVEYSKVHKYSHHRLRIGASDPFIKPSPIVIKRELPTSPLHSLWLRNGSTSSMRFIESFKLLTVLNLNVKLDVDILPEVILSCIYLRYLVLRMYSIEAVSPEIANIWKLETLIINWYGYSKRTCWLPVCMWNMKSLRHLYIDNAGLSLEDSNQKNSGNLFGGSSSIESLGVIKLNEDDITTSEILRGFPNLRNLSCGIAGHILKFISMVGSLLTHLESLKVVYGNGLPYLQAPNPLLYNFAKIENLKKLSLRYTRVPWSVLSDIGKQLPNLHVLKLLWKSCSGQSWEVRDGNFSKLIYLKFYGLGIEKIDVSNCDDNPFPFLEHLVLEDCQYLREIPSTFEEISTLSWLS